MSLARTTLQPLHVAARSSLHSHALARRTAGAVPQLSSTALRTAVTRRTVSTTSRTSSSSASSAARWTAIAALGGSLALGLSVMQTRSVYMEEAQGDKASSVKKKGKKESKKDEGGESDAPQKQAKKGKSEQSAKTPREEKANEAETDAAGSDEPRNVKEDDVQEASSLDMDDLSEEASQQSAFDPETNTINWDCPCLGGMAHGPCGEQFKEAFSCFVFSEADPKGVDCIDHFKAMQDCFRKYPEHYKEELEDEEEAGGAGEDTQVSGKAGGSESKQVGSDDQEEDEGLREWRAEMAKEQS